MGNKFFKQSTGIVTGDNHSVSIANITLHFILLPIATTLSKAELFKRYIDDIVWLSYNLDTTNHIRDALTTAFDNASLEVTFRSIHTGNFCNSNKLEFLNVEHQTDDSFKGGFFTKNFVKPTATDRCFLHGHSHHPPNVYKSIVFGEAVRLRRLNESQEFYEKSLQQLRIKCLNSNFDKKIVDQILGTAKTWTDRFKSKSNNSKREFKKQVWATSFTNCITLTSKEKKLNPSSIVVYKKPRTLQTILINYKLIALNLNYNTTDEGFSKPCGKCALCGNRGPHKNMVRSTKAVKNENGISYKIRQQLDCTNFGIYAAQCKLCSNYYVGQSKNRFSLRWNGHRHIWNSCSLENEKAALYIHYNNQHPNHIKSQRKLWDCYEVIFLQEPNPHQLDFLESKWISRLQAKINIKDTILPKNK